MSDLEPVGDIIPRVFSALWEESGRRLPADLRARNPPTPYTPDPDPIHTWTTHTPPPPWPPNLHARLIEIRESIQSLDLDHAITRILDLESSIISIERAAEHTARRHAAPPTNDTPTTPPPRIDVPR